MTIAVSGNGIAGLSVALAALNAGQSISMFGNMNPTNPPTGGVQLAPNGWRALEQLGISAAAMAQATQLSHICVRDLNSGVTLTRLPLENYYASISRADLWSILHKAIASKGAITHHSTLIKHVVSHNSGVNIVCDNNTTMKATALIAADGLGGFGQHFVSGTTVNINKRQGNTVAMRATIETSQLPALFSQATSNLWLGQGLHVVHYPITGRSLVNLTITLPAPLIKTNWQIQLFDSNPALRCLMDSKIIWTKTPLLTASSQMCWRRERVVLAGDAAHSMPPHLAQGAGQALQDAATLYIALANTTSIQEALSQYARERSTAVSSVVQKAEISGKIMALGGVSGRLRNVLINAAGPNFLKSWLADVWANDPGITS
jgi:salicylate hydroxylase